MVELKVISGKNLLKILVKLGAEINKGKGSHFKVKLSGKNSVIPVHSNNDITKGLLYSILKQLDILDDYEKIIK